MGLCALPAFALLVSLGTGAYEITPQKPTACDVVKLTVRQTFAEDCQWRANAKVESTNKTIFATLHLAADNVCDQAFIDMEFDFELGSFPAGAYSVIIHWADTDARETVPLVIADGTCR